MSDATTISPYVVVDATTKLLTRLKISHTGSSAAAVGDTFDITLSIGGVTSFVDDNGFQLQFDGSSEFTGTVTIVTPEPSTVGLLLVGVVGIAGLRLRRSRLLSTVAQRSAA